MPPRSKSLSRLLLGVLRNLGDYNPPVMIDTVMGVLDNESREMLFEEYFPNLAEQTILLCTTSEVRPLEKRLYEASRPSYRGPHPAPRCGRTENYRQRRIFVESN